mgnify:CR=1
MSDEQIKLEVIRLLLATGVPHDVVVEKSIPISEWILGSCNQKQPSCTGEKE